MREGDTLFFFQETGLWQKTLKRGGPQGDLVVSVKGRQYNAEGFCR
jgi:hypothetical protein